MAIIVEKIVSEDLNLGIGEVNVRLPGGGGATGHQIHIGTFVPNLRSTHNRVGDLSTKLNAAEAELVLLGGGVIISEAPTGPTAQGAIVVVTPDADQIAQGPVMLTHRPFPYVGAAPSGQGMSMIELNMHNTGAGPDGGMYGIRIQTEADFVDKAAGVQIFNTGKADGIYILCAGKDNENSSPTGLAVDVNKEVTSSDERTTVSGQQGIQVWDWSTTNQFPGNPGPRLVFINKQSNMDTNHEMLVVRGNRSCVRIITKTNSASYSSTEPVFGIHDEVSGIDRVLMTAGGAVILGNMSPGIEFRMASGNAGFLRKSAGLNEITLVAGNQGFRINNNAGTATILTISDPTHKFTFVNPAGNRSITMFDTGRTLGVHTTGADAATVRFTVVGGINREWDTGVHDALGYFFITDLSAGLNRLRINTDSTTWLESDLRIAGELSFKDATASAEGISFPYAAGNPVKILRQGVDISFIAPEGGGFLFRNNLQTVAPLLIEGDTGTLVAYGAIFERHRAAPMGNWINQAFNAGHFTAASGTWTVESGDLNQFKYALIGDFMYIALWVSGFTTTGAGNELRFQIPGGYTCSTSTFSGWFHYSIDGSAGTVGHAVSTAGGGAPYIRLFKPDSSQTWGTIGTGSFRISIAIQVEQFV